MKFCFLFSTQCCQTSVEKNRNVCHPSKTSRVRICSVLKSSFGLGQVVEERVQLVPSITRCEILFALSGSEASSFGPLMVLIFQVILSSG